MADVVAMVVCVEVETLAGCPVGDARRLGGVVLVIDQGDDLG